MSGKKEIHVSMRRLYEAVEQEKSQLAKTLNISPQTVSNWEDRGISKKGLEIVIEKFPGLNSSHILTGEGVNLFKSPSLMASQAEHRKRVLIARHNSSKNNKHNENKVLRMKYVPVKSYSKMDDDGYYIDMGYQGDSEGGYVPSLTVSTSAYAVRGDGMSMYPAVRHGWYLVCDPEVDPVPTEFVEVELKDGRRTIKEFIGIVNNVLHLSGVNGDIRLSFDMENVKTISAITDIIPPSRHLYQYKDINIKEYDHD